MPNTILGEHALTIPVGTTAERPASPADGMIRKNSSTGYLEYYNTGTSSWLAIGAIAATGGTVTTSGSYTYHAFTSSGTLQVFAGGTIDTLMAGGGGGGGKRHGGGGGAGGLVVKLNQAIVNGNYTVTIGAGGDGSTSGASVGTGGSKGGDTTFNGWTAIGGGVGYSDGAFSPDPSYDGGSGGGCEHNRPGLNAAGNAQQPGSATGGFGSMGGSYDGSGSPTPGGTASEPPYCGGGGGGANGVGGRPVQATGTSNGGPGLFVSQFTNYGTNDSNGTSGTRGHYCGGGAGGQFNGSVSSTHCRGGVGGGGVGQSATNGTSAGAGMANTGGGGGGDGSDTANAANGGSGIVIVRYIG